MRKINYPLLLFLLSFMGISEIVAAESTEEKSSATQATVAEEIKQSETKTSSQSKEKGPEGTTSSSSSVEEESEKTEADNVAPQALGGDGSQANPFTVSTYNDLRTAISSNNVDPITGTKYVQLTNDILLTDGDFSSLIIDTNIEINGIKDPSLPSSPENYWHLNMRTGGDVTMFRTVDNGTASLYRMNITFKNINFGSTQYPQNSWYGFVRVLRENTTLNVENINYNILRGSQPFFSNRIHNIVNISGNNVFNSTNTILGQYGGEFVEGYEFINFKEDSDTKISNYNDTDTAFFYMITAAMLTVTVEKNAAVAIDSGQRMMFYDDYNRGNQKIILKENANFTYKVRDFPGYAQNELVLGEKKIDMDMGEGSSFKYLTKDRPINLKANLEVQAFDPASMYIGKSDDATYNGQAILRGNAKVSNKGSNFYQAITTNTVINGAVPPWAAAPNNSDVWFISTGYAGESWVEYLPSMSLDSVSATSNVGNKLSEVLANLGNFETGLQDGWVFKAEYILSKTPYTDSDGRLDQLALRNVFDVQDKPEGVYTFTGDELAVPAGEDRKFLAGNFEDLLAQNYYIYGRVKATRSSDNYTGSTLWVGNTVNVPQYIATVFPTSIRFYSLKGPLLTWPNEKYLVESYSNVPTYITMTDMAVAENSDSSVSLVGAATSGDSFLNLDFLATLTASKNKTTWPAYTNGNGQVLRLSPYFEDDSEAEIGFDGRYSGPYYSVKKVHYNLKFNISDTNP